MLRPTPKRRNRGAKSLSSRVPKPLAPVPPVAAAPLPVMLTLWLGSKVMPVRPRTDGKAAVSFDPDNCTFHVPAGTTVERCLEIGAELVQEAMTEYAKGKGARHGK